MHIHDSMPAQQVLYTKILLLLAESKGVVITDLLDFANIDFALLSQPGQHISLKQFSRLVQRTKELVNDPGFFLSLGEEIGKNIPQQGKVGAAVFSSFDFTEGVKRASRFIGIAGPMCSMDYYCDSNTVTIRLESKISEPSLYQSEIEMVLASIFQGLRQLSLGEEVVERVCFRFPKPNYSELYQHFFGDLCEFNGEYNAIRFSIETISKRWTQGGDFDIGALALKHCENTLAQLRDSFSISQRISLLIDAHPKGLPCKNEIAQRLNMSVRSLTRCLEKENTTYMEVLDELRKNKAMAYLKDGEWTLDEIATNLGYRSASSFSRAFKQWLGISPMQYRKKCYTGTTCDTAKQKNNLLHG